MSSSFTTLLSSLPALAEAAVHGGAEGGAHAAPPAKHEVSAKAQSFFSDSHHWAAFLTNSVFVAALVTVIFLWFFRSAMKKPTLIPGKRQNLVELIVDFLYNQVANIVGPKVAISAFPLLATIFIYVTISNWVGLLPGVGTIGFTHHSSGLAGLFATSHIETPLLRPATADMNLTFGLAFCALISWFYITIREVGLGGFLAHTFTPPSMIKGGLRAGLFIIFIMVGIIEIISIAFRPMTLSLRLYGNVFAGENLLHTAGSLVHTGYAAVDFLSSVIIPIPFYFLEILVGVLQGMVFALLCAVFIKLSTGHDEGHEAEEHAHH
ncbi:MAG: atpB [Verrucomicrobiales bacterium]|nr:atpB [Verrucomicrobiales bacterium]